MSRATRRNCPFLHKIIRSEDIHKMAATFHGLSGLSFCSRQNTRCDVLALPVLIILRKIAQARQIQSISM